MCATGGDRRNLDYYKWVNLLGSDGNEFCSAVTLDADDNMFITGTVINPIDLGGGSLTGNGSQDIYVAKYAAIPARNQVHAERGVQRGQTPGRYELRDQPIGCGCDTTMLPDISCVHPGPLAPGDPPLTLTLIATINDGALIVANTALVFTPMDSVEPNNTDTFVFTLDTPAPVLSMPTLVGLIALLSLVGYFGLYREPLRAKSKRPGPPS